MPNLRKSAVLIGLPLVLLGTGALLLFRPSADSHTSGTAPPAEAEPTVPGEVQLEANQIEALGIRLQASVAATSLPVGGLAAEAMPPLTASTQVNLPFAGVITRLHVDEGQTVKRGQPLLQWQSQELIRLQAELARNRSEAGLAQQQAARDALLANEGIIPAARKSESTARAAMASASLAEAQAQLAQLRPATGGAPGEYTLLAPRSGRVLRRMVLPGQAVEALGAAFVMAEGDALDIYFNVPLSLRPLLAPGLAVQLPDGGQARLAAIGADTDANSQTLRLRAEASAGGELLPGQQFEVRLSLPAPDGAVQVPLSALAPHGEKEVLYLAEGKRFRACVVERLAADGDIAVVRAPELVAGMQVVSHGVGVLKSLAPPAE